MATGLMKKYIKLADGDFKKAWKLQKAAQKKKGKKKPVKKKAVKKKAVKRKAVKKKTVRKKAVKKRVVKKSPVRKTVKKKTVKRKAVSQKRKGSAMAKKKKSAPRKRRKSSGGGKIQKTLMTGAMAAAGAIGAGVAANYIPVPDPRLKAALPIVAGVFLGSTKMGRSAMMQTVAAGMVAAGTLALVKQVAPQVPLLAGEDDELTFVPSNYTEQAMLGVEEPFTMGEAEYVGYDDDDDDDDMMGAAFDLQGEYESYPGQF